MSTTAPTNQSQLPNYVVINDDNCPDIRKKILREGCATVEFPLTFEVRAMIDQLVQKYDAEENCAGLAAPQVGFPIRVTVFGVKVDEAMKKWRPDLTEGMPKTVWINPTYEGVGTEKHRDYEGCFSVKDLACEVNRFKKIKYTAYDMDGHKVEGQATGFLARVIQHEIDHLNGTLCIDQAIPGTIMSRDTYRAMRQAAEQGTVNRTIHDGQTVTNTVDLTKTIK